ncbi:MAG: cation:dicarboxylase symporter family transporter [Flammeovirgaceae bacterium]|nr:MAG: cation:dicarboxylase symporter family transporter [Flammeovirgaceae bacterium]
MPKPSHWISIGSLLGLTIGITAGLYSESTPLTEFLFLSAEVFSRSWILVLLVLAIPLVAGNLIISFLTLLQASLFGKLAVRGLIVHILLLGSGAVVSVGLSYFLSRGLPSTAFASTTALHNTVSFRILSVMAETQQLLTRFIIPAILCSIVGAIILSRIGKGFRYPVIDRLTRAVKKLFNWLKILFQTLPLSVGCIAFVITSQNGLQLAGTVGFYVAGVCAVLVVVTALMYVVVLLFGSTPVRHFAHAMLPSQLLAASTSSSLASLPALLVSTTKFTGEEKITGMAVPLFVSFFRINLMVANPFSFFLLSRLYGLPVEWPNLLMFLGLMMITSFGSPGLPQMGKVYSLPVFLAAGIPLEGVMVLKAVDAIPDVFKTVLNVTEIGTVTSVMLRGTATPAATQSVTVESTRL